jgi:hypothetical protein
VGFSVSENLIEAAEGELGARLLPEHRARLAANNGGDVICDGEQWQLYPVQDVTDRRRAARTANHIVYETREAREWDRFPRDGIAIASHGSGVLLIFRPLRGRIELWDHETGECVPVDVQWTST